MNEFPPGFEWSDEEQRPVYRSPARPVEPEPTLVDGKPICPHCGWGGDHIDPDSGGVLFHCEDCAKSFTAEDAAKAQVAQAVESGKRRLVRQGRGQEEYPGRVDELAYELADALEHAEEALRLQREREAKKDEAIQHVLRHGKVGKQSERRLRAALKGDEE